MKKLIALCLALSLLLAASACAEGVYMRQLSQNTYLSAKLIAQEAYPEVRITTNSMYDLFGRSEPKEAVFLCFPGPDNALSNSFDYDTAYYLDVDNAIQYIYQLRSSDSYEEFTNKAAQEDYILLDGSNGVAAYIDPDRCKAYGMIGMQEFGKSAKLYIQIGLDKLGSKTPLETRVQELSLAILNELQRVYPAMHTETLAPYWSDGAYVGVKLLGGSDDEFLLEMDFPVMTVAYADGSQLDANYIPTSMDDYSGVEGLYNFGNGMYLGTDIKVDDNPFAQYKLDNNDQDAFVATLSDGSEWVVYMSYFTENGYASSCYASTKLNRQDRYGAELYLTLEFSGNGQIRWESQDDFLSDLSLFTNYAVVNTVDDPYEEPVNPVVAPTAAPANEGAWMCPNCGQANEGKFCSECGTPRPVSNEWTCPTCGQVNESKFCSNCGTARP